MQPYPLKSSDNVNYFETDHGVIYTYGFDNVTSTIVQNVSPKLSDMSFHYFGFSRTGEGKPDPRVAPTIGAIAEQFFQDNSRVMLYVCDSHNKRGKSRQVLFRKWFTIAGYQLDQVEFDLDTDIIYAGVVTVKDMPYRKTLENEFLGRVGSIFSMK